MKTIALVMGVHNAVEYADKVLLELDHLPQDVNFVVVDDASSPENAEHIRGMVHCFDMRQRIVLRNEKQQLFTRTYNRGIRYAYHNFHPEFIVCLNSDLDLKRGWLDWLIKGFVDPSVGMVGYRDNHDPDLFRKKSYTEQRRPEYVTGHCFGLRTKMLEEIGILCETDLTGRDSPELAPFKGQAHIGSDRILSWRANLAGWKTMYCNYPGCFHEGGKSWKHDLQWLTNFDLQPLWEPCDTLEEPVWYDN